MINEVYNFSQKFGLARDQGARPTCLAFSVSDMNMFANALSASLSVEYLCYHAAHNMTAWKIEQPFTCSAVMNAAREPGQPSEVSYPYDSNDQGKPLITPPLFEELKKVDCRYGKGNVEEIVDAIVAGNPIIIIISLTEGFMRPKDGIVFDEQEPENVYPGLHAVLVVGSGEMVNSDEQYFYIRNSWGREWGENGHSWISNTYLRRHLVGTIRI